LLTCSDTGTISEKTVETKTTKVSLTIISVKAFTPYTDFQFSPKTSGFLLYKLWREKNLYKLWREKDYDLVLHLQLAKQFVTWTPVKNVFKIYWNAVSQLVCAIVSISKYTLPSSLYYYCFCSEWYHWGSEQI